MSVKSWMRSVKTWVQGVVNKMSTNQGPDKNAVEVTAQFLLGADRLAARLGCSCGFG